MTKWSDILPSWALELSQELAEKAHEERLNGENICPPQDQIFGALRLTTPDNLKVCIVGQDPYHTPGVANGLAFSVASDAKIPPSLRNIYKEFVSDLNLPMPLNGDLSPWARQGVLLLNTTLTVYEHRPNSHANWGWNFFTKSVLETAVELSQPIVFVLWGANAQDLKDSLIKCAAVPEGKGIIKQNIIKKAIVMSSHPSPFSATKPCRDTPPFLGSKPFSTINRLLKGYGSEPIDWRL